ncbi:hypothetical protein [Curtobacterium sp. S6]|uniref:hypothetical protein n=1 Tax=Curtobacterium sp. S6 TaxID=1479623 RepID=UPI0004AA5E01|nr:hypothetical protein [Curtobacterium sp. S6]
MNFLKNADHDLHRQRSARLISAAGATFSTVGGIGLALVFRAILQEVFGLVENMNWFVRFWLSLYLDVGVGVLIIYLFVMWLKFMLKLKAQSHRDQQ